VTMNRNRAVSGTLLMIILFFHGLSVQAKAPAAAGAPDGGSVRMKLQAPETWSLGRDIKINLCIANNSKHTLVFPLFDTFRLIMTTADGKNVVEYCWGRRATRYVQPVVVPPGQEVVVSRSGKVSLNQPSGKLSLNQPSGKLKFEFDDQTGAYNLFLNLTPGTYQITCNYANPTRHLSPGLNEDKAAPCFTQPCWTGKLTTDPVVIHIVQK
jgi:hypothetical protein